MNKYKQFIFKDYVFNEQTKTLELIYSLDNIVDFHEKYVFDFDFISYDKEQLDLAISNLFIMAGVSYFKAYIPSEIVVSKGRLDSTLAEFFSKTYSKGLGEFWYVNKLDPNTKVSFPVNTDSINSMNNGFKDGLLIGLGGGKDSLVIVEGLRNSGKPVSTWSLNHRSQFEPLVKTVGLKHLFVERVIDNKLLELNKDDALNGHVPISTIIACTGVIVTILSGNRDVVVGNEQTANEPTLEYNGVDINHQYSKTQEFEKDFQGVLSHLFGDSLRYYSFLRPLSELRIAEIFVKDSLDKYFGVFSSCNKAYTLSSNSMSWCGVCPKCVFMFLILTPFVERAKLESIWGGKNLLLDPNLSSTVKEILGISGERPLDCVGEVKESRAAMRLDQKVYPELVDQYVFDLPEDYDYKQIWSDEMPEDIKPLFKEFISKFE